MTVMTASVTAVCTSAIRFVQLMAAVQLHLTVSVTTTIQHSSVRHSNSHAVISSSHVASGAAAVGTYGRAVPTRHDDAPLTCFEAWLRCRGDVTCRVLIDVFNQACDETVNTCVTLQRLHCHSALSSLQTNVYFRRCECNPDDTDLSDCKDIQRRIFSHSCVQRQDASAILPTTPSAIVPHTDETESPTGGVASTPYPVEHGKADQSCIGARRRCMTSPQHGDGGGDILPPGHRDDQEELFGVSATTCAKSLADYRLYCRESKKTNQCIALDWLRCQKAIDELQTLSPELLHCSCPMTRNDLLDTCERIQWRLVNNTCLETTSYVTKSTILPVPVYVDLVSAVEGIEHEPNEDIDDSSCLRVFAECQADGDQCRPEAERFVDACSWNSSGGGDCGRERAAECREAARRFYAPAAVNDGLPPSASTGRDFRLQRALLFCRCDAADGHGAAEVSDRAGCLAVQSAFQRPACTSFQLPPPNCLNVVRWCDGDPLCRARRQSYVRHCIEASSICAHQVRPGDIIWKQEVLAAIERCASAMVGLQGTIATLNCSCSPAAATVANADREDGDNVGAGATGSGSDPDAVRERCEAARSQLPLADTTCTRMVVDKFWSTYLPINDKWPSATIPSNTAPSITSPNARDQECRRLLSESTVSLLNGPPFFIRVYHRASSTSPMPTDCSDLCVCHENGTTNCRSLLCPDVSHCRHNETVYVHGSSFYLHERGRCQCTKAEIICAKADRTNYRPSQPGLFLHVGYSTAEQRLIERQSMVRFQPSSLRRKLMMLLPQSHRQVCGVKLHQAFNGNIVYEIQPLLSDLSARPLAVEGCVSAAKLLNLTINSGNWRTTPVVDPELSLLKVSQIERVQFHSNPTASNAHKWTNGKHTLARSRATNVDGLGRILLATTTCAVVINYCLHLTCVRRAVSGRVV